MTEQQPQVEPTQEFLPIRFAGFAVSICVSATLWGIAAFLFASSNWWLTYYMAASGTIVLGGITLSLGLKKFQLRSQRWTRLIVALVALIASAFGLVYSNESLFAAGALLSCLFSLSNCKPFGQTGLRFAPLLLGAPVLWTFTVPSIQDLALRFARTVSTVSIRAFESAFVGEPQRLIYPNGAFEYSELSHNWHYYASVFAAAIFLVVARRDMVTSVVTLVVACVTCLAGLCSFAVVVVVKNTPMGPLGSPDFEWPTPLLLTLVAVIFFLSAERLISVLFCPISAGHLGGKANPFAAAWNAAFQLGQQKPDQFDWWSPKFLKPATTSVWPAVLTIVFALSQIGCGAAFALQSPLDGSKQANLLTDASPLSSSRNPGKLEDRGLVGSGSEEPQWVLVDQRLTDTRTEHSLKPLYSDDLLVVAGHRSTAQISALQAARGVDVQSVAVDLSAEGDESALVPRADLLKADQDVAQNEKDPSYSISSFFIHHHQNDFNRTPVTICWTRTWYSPQSQTTLATDHADFLRAIGQLDGLSQP